MRKTYKIVYTPNGYRAETKFEAVSRADAVELFALTQPDVGAVTVIDDGHLDCWIISQGVPRHIYCTEDLDNA